MAVVGRMGVVPGMGRIAIGGVWEWREVLRVRGGMGVALCEGKNVAKEDGCGARFFLATRKTLIY